MSEITEKLILNDGTELAGYLLPDRDAITLYIMGGTIAGAYPLLSDPALTAKIVYDNNGRTSEYDGFTYLFSLREEQDGTLTAGLRMEADE